MSSNKPLIYIPRGAKLNISGTNMETPKVKYEKRKSIIDIETVKKVVGGKYGRSAKNSKP